MLFFASCSATPPPGREREALDTLEGEITVIGSDPLERQVLLADTSGVLWALHAPGFIGELLSIAGHGVRVAGRVLRCSGSMAVMRVDGYELLPVDGSTPIVGALRIEGEQLILNVVGSNERHVLAGPLEQSLRIFAGFKVWILVEDVPEDAVAGPGMKRLNVKNYGVLGPAGTLTRLSPEDIPRD